MSPTSRSCLLLTTVGIPLEHVEVVQVMSKTYGMQYAYTVYSGYSGHVYTCSGHSDIVATFPGTKYILILLYIFFVFIQLHIQGA